MSEIDDYFQNVRALADAAVKAGQLAHTLIEAKGPSDALLAGCVKIRKGVITDDEAQMLHGYLAIGLFAGWRDADRLAVWAVCFDVQYELDRMAAVKQCERYNQSQPLFVGAPHLFSHVRKKSSGEPDLELIDAKAVSAVGESEIYGTSDGFGKLSPYLSPAVVNWARKKSPDCPTYIRLDPFEFHKEQPLQLLTEATLAPANPKWLQNFSLHKGKPEYACYVLLDRPAADAPAEFWDYHLRHLRRLEVRVERREDDYLTMMIEELPRQDDPNGLMLARCIHLDTKEPALTPPDCVKLQHLDLAINVYEGRDRRRRFEQSLQHGKVCDASHRTHLFRIEGVPFASLFSYCTMFLRSRVLLNEWFGQIFGSKTPI